MSARALILFVVVFPGSVKASDPGVLVDRVVAVVGEEVLTRTELITETRIALIFRGGVQAALGSLGENALTTFRDYVVNQMVVAIHVRRVGTVDVSEERVTAAVTKFKAQFSSVYGFRAFLRKFDVREEQVRSIARRDLGNQIFLERRLKSREAAGAATNQDDDWSYNTLGKMVSDMRQTVRIKFPGKTEVVDFQ